MIRMQSIYTKMTDYNKHEWLNLWKELFSHRFNDEIFFKWLCYEI